MYTCRPLAWSLNLGQEVRPKQRANDELGRRWAPCPAHNMGGHPSPAPPTPHGHSRWWERGTSWQAGTFGSLTTRLWHQASWVPGTSGWGSACSQRAPPPWTACNSIAWNEASLLISESSLFRHLYPHRDQNTREQVPKEGMLRGVGKGSQPSTSRDLTCFPGAPAQPSAPGGAPICLWPLEGRRLTHLCGLIPCQTNCAALGRRGWVPSSLAMEENNARPSWITAHSPPPTVPSQGQIRNISELGKMAQQRPTLGMGVIWSCGPAGERNPKFVIT